MQYRPVSWHVMCNPIQGPLLHRSGPSSFTGAIRTEPTRAPRSARRDAHATEDDMARHGGRQWRALRLRILQRDNHQCQINHRGCTLIADQVDHITPLVDGGAKYDPRNLRAACTHCNASLGASMGNARRDRRVSRTW